MINRSTLQRSTFNIVAEIERQLIEIDEFLKRISPATREAILDVAGKKLGRIYNALGVLLEDLRRENVSSGELAKIDLYQRNIMAFKLSLRTKTTLELLVIMKGFKERFEEIFVNK
ncbi:hypothetical protein HYV87_01705 [Candidatus Woesearchaeota archaeon]|nr:hypothetical protein [Candidatus Woesearchaeota archaeon]MBI2581828.1 hypothetical protein [Candidatus Woesearchaeota archaeon]